MKYKIIEGIGWLSALSAVFAWVMLPWLDLSNLVGVDRGVGLILAMQVCVGSFLAYASRMKRAGVELGHKLYPASFVSFFLYLVITHRWLSFTG